MNETQDRPIQIGELARQLGITTRTIRYYEEIGLMGPTQRPEGGMRSYQRDEVLRLKFILKMKELGITLKEMQELARNFDIHQQDFHTITPQLLDILDFHIKKIDTKITSLTSLKSEIVDYRVRILAILNGKEPVVR
ncbi:MAG: MerR family transcriptional regulator [Pelovirga sp.]